VVQVVQKLIISEAASSPRSIVQACAVLHHARSGIALASKSNGLRWAGWNWVSYLKGKAQIEGEIWGSYGDEHERGLKRQW
jgi:hypothetical protein